MTRDRRLQWRTERKKGTFNFHNPKSEMNRFNNQIQSTIIKDGY